MATPLMAGRLWNILLQLITEDYNTGNSAITGWNMWGANAGRNNIN